jgi:membrane protease YdiL (CAAX protease family)
VLSRSRTTLAAFSLAAIAAPFVLARLDGRLPSAERELWRIFALQLCWCGLACLVALRLGGSVRDRLGLARGELGAGRLAFGVLGTLALSGALQFGVDALALAPGTSLERVNGIATAGAASNLPLLLLGLGIAPGFGEELLLRGALQRSLERAMGAWCVPAAALAFGVLHMDPVHSPAAFALGCYLGALAFLGRNTWIAIACHVANNCAAALAQLPGVAVGSLPKPESWATAGLWVAAASLCLVAAAAPRRRRSPPLPSPSG